MNRLRQFTAQIRAQFKSIISIVILNRLSHAFGLIPNRYRKLLLFGGILLALLSCLLLRSSRRGVERLEVSFWYWKYPYQITNEERLKLRAIGVRRLYVRTGTLVRRGTGLAMTLPQVWRTHESEFEIVLVFNLGYDIVRSFKDLPNTTLASEIIRLVEQERGRAIEAGVKVTGVQFDFDCPTRRLQKYADLLRQLDCLRANRKYELSITGLPTWFTSGDVREVMQRVDFTVPQFYEPGLSRNRSSLVPISSLKMLSLGLDRVGNTGQPFMVGLPAYGHALLYDEKGELDSIYHDLAARDAVRLPSFRILRSAGMDADGRPLSGGGPEVTSGSGREGSGREGNGSAGHNSMGNQSIAHGAEKGYIGEDLLELEAVEPASNGNGKGYHLLYEIPTAEMVAQHIALVKREATRTCRGIILFRYPEYDEAMTVPLDGIEGVLHGKPVEPKLDVEVRVVREKMTWNIIEGGGGAKESSPSVQVTVKNIGAANSLIDESAVEVALLCEIPSMETELLSSSDMDGPALSTYRVSNFEELWGDLRARGAASASLGERLSGYRSSANRSNLILLSLPHIASGERIPLAQLRFSHSAKVGKQSIRVFWRCRCQGGFRSVFGETKSMDLKQKP